MSPKQYKLLSPSAFQQGILPSPSFNRLFAVDPKWPWRNSHQLGKCLKRFLRYRVTHLDAWALLAGKVHRMVWATTPRQTDTPYRSPPDRSAAYKPIRRRPEDAALIATRVRGSRRSNHRRRKLLVQTTNHPPSSNDLTCFYPTTVSSIQTADRIDDVDLYTLGNVMLKLNVRHYGLLKLLADQCEVGGSVFTYRCLAGIVLVLSRFRYWFPVADGGLGGSWSQALRVLHDLAARLDSPEYAGLLCEALYIHRVWTPELHRKIASHLRFSPSVSSPSLPSSQDTIRPATHTSYSVASTSCPTSSAEGSMRSALISDLSTSTRVEHSRANSSLPPLLLLLPPPGIFSCLHWLSLGPVTAPSLWFGILGGLPVKACRPRDLCRLMEALSRVELHHVDVSHLQSVLTVISWELDSLPVSLLSELVASITKMNLSHDAFFWKLVRVIPRKLYHISSPAAIHLLRGLLVLQRREEATSYTSKQCVYALLSHLGKFTKTLTNEELLLSLEAMQHAQLIHGSFLVGLTTTLTFRIQLVQRLLQQSPTTSDEDLFFGPPQNASLLLVGVQSGNIATPNDNGGHFIYPTSLGRCNINSLSRIPSFGWLRVARWETLKRIVELLEAIEPVVPYYHNIGNNPKFCPSLSSFLVSSMLMTTTSWANLYRCFHQAYRDVAAVPPPLQTPNKAW